MQVRYVRWWVCGMLFTATVISYVDRQTMSVAVPVIAQEYDLTNEQVGRILASFLLAYAFGQLLAGKFLDWVGSRAGFAISITFWSLANVLTATVTRVWGFSFFRFMLGLGEAGNYPGGVKVVTEWFPPHERAFAGGVFTSGASIGAVIAAPLVATITHYWGWRAAFVATGALGFVWLIGWLLFYEVPAKHSMVMPDERALLDKHLKGGPPPQTWRWLHLFRFRQVWALTIARFFEEPLIWLSVFWLPKYLVDVRGLSLLETGWVLTIPYIALDIGYVSGGWGSGRLVRRGWTTQKAKLAVMLVGMVLMLGAIPAAFAGQVWQAVMFISLATMGHGIWFANMLTMPSDITPVGQVASVYGITALGGALGGIISTELTGIIADKFDSFTPALVVAGFLPVVATAVLKLVGRDLRPLSTGPQIHPDGTRVAPTVSNKEMSE